jgi:hypothetical protein
MTKQQLLLGAGAALALTMAFATTATAQEKAPPGYQAPAAAAPASKPDTAAGDQVAVTFSLPARMHIPGEKSGMYPAFIDTKSPEGQRRLQEIANTQGVQAVQDMVDGTLTECGDIYDVQDMLLHYQQHIVYYDDEGKKLQDDLPRHVVWQRFLTLVDGGTQVAMGAVIGSAGGPIAAKEGGLYAAGAIVRTIKQDGNDRWSGRLDKHFLNGSDLQVEGVRIQLKSEQIYIREMDKYCPVLEGYVAKYGKSVLVTH